MLRADIRKSPPVEVDRVACARSRTACPGAAARSVSLMRDLAERVPLERHEPGRDVDLLDHRVDDEAALRAALHRLQVLAHDRVGDDDRLVVRRDLELVQVGAEAVGRADAADDAVGLVEHHHLAGADALARRAAPVGEHRLALVGLGAEVGGGRDARAAGRTRSAGRCCRRSAGRPASRRAWTSGSGTGGRAPGRGARCRRSRTAARGPGASGTCASSWPGCSRGSGSGSSPAWASARCGT